MPSLSAGTIGRSTRLCMDLWYSTSTVFYSIWFSLLTVDVEQCFDSVGRQITGNRLKLNNDQIEALLVGPRKRVNVSQENHLRVGNHDISTKDHAKKSRGLHWCNSVYGEAYWPYKSLSISQDQKNSSTRDLLTTKATAQLVFFCSQSVGLLQFFAHWHQLWLDVKAPKCSKPCSEGCFSQEQTWAC